MMNLIEVQVNTKPYQVIDSNGLVVKRYSYLGVAIPYAVKLSYAKAGVIRVIDARDGSVYGFYECGEYVESRSIEWRACDISESDHTGESKVNRHTPDWMLHHPDYRKCARCKGTGELTGTYQSTPGHVGAGFFARTCPACKGEGYVYKSKMIQETK
jgi:hypothetical protein